MKKTLILLPVLFFLVVFLGLNVSAAAVQVNLNENTGLDISYPKYNTIKINTSFQLNLHVYNKSNGLQIDNTTTNCTLHLHSLDGTHLWKGGFNYDLEGGDFYLNVNKNNFTEEGIHAYEINCQSTNIGGFASNDFDITLNGKERPEGIVKVIFFAFFLLLLFGALLSFLKVLGHWKDLEVDIIDLATTIGIYFVIFAFQYLAINYLGDLVINDFMELMVIVGAITHVFVPLVAFATSLIFNPFRKGAK